ncbi:MAG: response regulator [Peptococcaceae bacterium]|nr:response regulator [Peptococcaceae bacterium]
MRYISLDLVEPGTPVARTIFDEQFRVLVGVGTPLTEIIIEKLRDKGYAGVYINDKLSEDIIIHETISTELKNRGVKSLKELNIDASLEVAKRITEQLLSSSDINLDIIDLRNFNDYTYHHSVNVCVLSTIIGIRLGLSEADLIDLSIAALLHDLGKLFIVPEILNKPDKLTDEEYAIIRQHPIASYEYIKDHYAISSTSKIATLYHHENEDGSGYPEGKKGDELHIFSKIIHVADIYDALTSTRPYKKAYAISEVVEYLMGGCDVLFNREIVEVFLKSVPLYPKGTMVRLSDNRSALIVANSDNPLRPIIRFEDGTDLNLNEDLSCQNLTIKPDVTVMLDFAEDIDLDPTILRTMLNKRPRFGTILVVDPSLNDADKLDRILERRFNLVMVENSHQALTYLRQNDLPDLIMMETDLPDCSGIETAKIIRQQVESKLPIIFLSRNANRDTVLKAKEINVKDFIIKPFQPAYIRKQIALALGVVIQ